MPWIFPLSAAAKLTINKVLACESAKIVLGAVAPTPIVASKAASKLSQRIIDGELISEVSALIEEEINPCDDVRSSSKYRESMANILTQRALKLAYQRALEDFEH